MAGRRSAQACLEPVARSGRLLSPRLHHSVKFTSTCLNQPNLSSTYISTNQTNVFYIYHPIATTNSYPKGQFKQFEFWIKENPNPQNINATLLRKQAWNGVNKCNGRCGTSASYNTIHVSLGWAHTRQLQLHQSFVFHLKLLPIYQLAKSLSCISPLCFGLCASQTVAGEAAVHWLLTASSRLQGRDCAADCRCQALLRIVQLHSPNLYKCTWDTDTSPEGQLSSPEIEKTGQDALPQLF